MKKYKNEKMEQSTANYNKHIKYNTLHQIKISQNIKIFNK